MSAPITPDPNIHNLPPAEAAQQSKLNQQQLQGLGQHLIQSVVNAVLSLLTGGLLGSQAGTNSNQAAGLFGNLFTNLFSLFGIGNGSSLTGSPSSFNPVQFVENLIGLIPILGPVIDGIINTVLGLTGGLIPVPNTSPSAIGTSATTSNLILNGSFNSAGSLASNPDWTWDSTVDHTASAGSGSAKTTANGAGRLMLSNQISVNSGQTLNLSGWAKWSGLVCGAGSSPIALGLQTYDVHGSVVANPVIQAVYNPAPSSNWIQLSGSYAVPAGVTSVAVTLSVGAAATAGTVWFDDISCVVAGSQLISAITGNPVINTVGGLFGWVGDLLGLLGNPFGMGSPGSSQPSGGTGTGSAAGGTVNNNTFDPKAGLQGLLNALLPAGVLSANTPVPAYLLSSLAPGTSNNVLPDPEFSSPTTLDGQGLWIWDWPGSVAQQIEANAKIPAATSTVPVWGTSHGSVRTRRPGTITVFYVPGTWEIMPGSTSLIIVTTGGPHDPAADPKDYLTWQTSNWTVDASGAEPLPNANLLDWSHFEFVKVNYPAAVFPMGGSVAQGVQALISLINSIPGKFILIGHSQGAGVISNVLDELRTGTLQHRYGDLLMGCAIGNMRRELGSGFPDPAGNEVVYSPDGYGIYVPTLKNTPSNWWEWAVPAGTYPGHGQLNGVVYATGDDISTLNDNPQAPAERKVIADTMALGIDTPNLFLVALGQGLNDITSPAGSAVLNSLGATGAHNTSQYQIQPFLAQGDTRTFYQYLFDHINSLAGSVSPPAIGIRHQLLGVPVPVQPEQVVTAGASAEWMNVVATGPQILVGVNAYDSRGNLIAFVTAPSATVINPQSVSGWVQLKADFVMPPGAATACLVLDVEPQAMTTGTVWFCQTFFEPTGIIDSALLANMKNIPMIPGANVQGPQGIADMLTAMQGVLDGLGTANSGANLTGAQLAQVFESQGQTAINAANALELAIAHNQTLLNTTNQPIFNGLQPTGEVTFSLQSFTAGTTLPSISVTAGTTIMGHINCAQAVTKGFIEFMAQGSGGSGVYVNVYKVNPTTGAMTKLYSSSDVSGSIPNGSFGWVSVTLPGNAEIPVTASELVALEIVAQGSAISVAGQTLAIPNHPAVVPPNMGATRATAGTGGVSPATLTEAQMTYSGAVPFISFGIANVPPTYQPPNQIIFTSQGSYTYNIPSWMKAGDFIDRVALGAGGAGVIGSTFLIFASPGGGGAPGKWATDTLVYGTDIPLTTKQLTVMVGAGGTPSNQTDTGGTAHPGAASSVSGVGVTALTAAGGAAGGSQATVPGPAGTPNLAATSNGQGPGNMTYQGRTYFGGPDVVPPSIGSYPGGGGGGGQSFGGAAGADGGVWITARQAGT